MERLLDSAVGLHPVVQALLATLFTWFVTAAGAAMVFTVRTIKRRLLDGMLGFTGGVMVAASYWSLLAPAIAMSPVAAPNVPNWFPAAVGFILGAMSLYALDKIIPHLHLNFTGTDREGLPAKWHGTILLVSAITLHNIPEGLAVGVAFGAVAYDLPGAGMGSAVALALGIAMQNFPEGIAVAMPLRRQGVSRLKSFWYGQLSAVVEPVAGVLGAVAVLYALPLLPYALSFAAGAMIYVVIEEVVPETQQEKYTDTSTIGFIIGFVIMMVLDVGLS